MKLPFTNDGSRMTMGTKSPTATRPASSGVALVITLIMLSVTLVMAVAFLAISRRERNSVSTTTDTATARLATDSALAAAQAQIAANILSSTNLAAYDFHLLVSTNYINPLGLNGSASPTNVNYDYDVNSNPLTVSGQQTNLANLLFLPRAPVFIYNRTTGSNDFRYYLDLNQNGMFETNNPSHGNPGDPEWIGVLEHPDQPHGPNNQFIARYAFLAQPIGNSLDLNYMFNQAHLPSKAVGMNLNGADFMRNQGVGSWELNLGAFLSDLNTNAWNSYTYDPTGTGDNGNAFNDALALYAYRLNGSPYNYTYNTAVLNSVNGLYGLNGDNVFDFDQIDGYSDGPLMTTNTLPFDNDNADTSYSWPGADTTNQFYSLPAELFDASKVSANFAGRLRNATSYSTNDYDRYTFYRMLDQLGTDSQPDNGKMNLNYRNITNGVVVAGMETNFYPWTAVDFFTNAADRVLRSYSAKWFAANPTNYLATYYGIIPNFYVAADGFGLTNTPTFGITNQIPSFGVANIPVYAYVNGAGVFLYSPAVNRILQLAANLYDATTNSSGVVGNNGHDFPSVFRPLFSRDANGLGADVYITGFTNVAGVAGTDDPQLATPVDIEALAGTNVAVLNLPVNVYNVPWIIGAKKGYPNFNNFTMANVIGLSRRLHVTRDTNSVPFKITGTNQLYIFNISEGIGWDFWNSYRTNYNGDILGQIRMNVTQSITNDEGMVPNIQVFANTNGFAVHNWRGNAYVTNEFAAPYLVSAVYRTPSAQPGTYGDSGITIPGFLASSAFGSYNVTQDFETNNVGFPFPHFVELATNRVQEFLLDTNSSPYRVIDYAQLRKIKSIDLNTNIFFPDSANINDDGVWDTNIDTDTLVPYGIENQIRISEGLAEITKNEDGSWNPDPQAQALGSTILQQKASFQAFFATNGFASATAKDKYSSATATNYLSSVQAPYVPSRYVVNYTVWQANDPLVHYLASDLTPSVNLNLAHLPLDAAPAPGTLLNDVNIGEQNNNYQPWGVSYGIVAGEVSYTTMTVTNLALKDPLVAGSDNWDFPANKLPSVGWLGRVHRGTPWQTVYLKSANILTQASGLNTWERWAGDANSFDATNCSPVQDEGLFDLFTSSLNDNASRGTLSVNQTHLAAWSAVLAGVTIATNINVPFTNTIVAPAGVAGDNSPLGQIVNGTNGINATRAAFRNLDNVAGTFENIGDILRTPALTVASPFLTGMDAKYMSDEVYEWLPQQTLGLLRDSSTRFVIYCYGQALRPAPSSILNSGAFFQMVTNYQVVAESAARAVIRVDNATVKGGSPHIVVESFNVLPPD